MLVGSILSVAKKKELRYTKLDIVCAGKEEPI